MANDKTTPQIVRVLVVDDSAFMRKALSLMLASDPEIEIVGTASNGEEGVEKTLLLKPDLVTMDIEMPRLDGLAALKEIMRRCPTPVMMVSSATTEGAAATLDAFELGAVDFIPKWTSYVNREMDRMQQELLAKIKNIAKRKKKLMARRMSPAFAASQILASVGHSNGQSTEFDLKTEKRLLSVVSIGVSTGGPPALQAIIPRLPEDLPVSVLIAQHMPPMFTKSLAERLDALSPLTVKEAEDGESLQPGTVYIAPGGKHLTVKRTGTRVNTGISGEPVGMLYKPSVDILMESAAEAYHRSVLAVILTGMGHDGLMGIKRVKSNGGIVIAQDEESCVVYGMPKAVTEAGLVDRIVPVDEIAQAIAEYF